MRVFAMGYSGTGSSAIVHLVKEYEKCQDDYDKAYEHVLFYAPHGLFDLEDAILNNNSIYHSDAAINDFYKEMKRLNDTDFGFFGGYQMRYGDRFMKIVNEFVDELIEFRRKGGWSNDYVYKFNFKVLLKDIVRKVLRRKIKRPFGKVLCVDGHDDVVNFCFDTPEQFYKKAKKFVDSYFEMIGYDEKKVIVTDQILQPQYLCKFINYAGENDRFIVVKRDSRDMFLNAKYIWSRNNGWTIFPTNPEDFSFFYKRLLNTEKKIFDPRILRINFEDLIYKYDETIKTIENFIGEEQLGAHVCPKAFFNPSQSIKNTQLFTICDEWLKESLVIKERMSEDIYAFPYSIKTSIEETSDPNPNTQKTNNK